MPVYNIFIINRAGSLIHNFDASQRGPDVEKVFSYPLDVRLEMVDQRATVTFGERNGIRVGYSVLTVNGETVAQSGRVAIKHSPPLENSEEPDEVDVLEYLSREDNFPMTIKFGRAPLTTNEKIILSSMFHSLYAIAAQLSPAATSSGIQQIEADQFTLFCFQTVPGTKFVAVADPNTTNLDSLCRKIYELYADYAMKNPFYSLDMPIRCELFDTNLQSVLERFNRSGILTV